MSPFHTLAQLERNLAEKHGAGDCMASLRLTEQAVEFQLQDATTHHLLYVVVEQVANYGHDQKVNRTYLKAGGDDARRISMLSAAKARPASQSIPTLAQGWRDYSNHVTLMNIHNAIYNNFFKVFSLPKNSSIFGLCHQQLWELNPRTNLQIGTSAGWSALRKASLYDTINYDCKIHSMNIGKVTNMNHSHVIFFERNGRKLAAKFFASLGQEFMHHSIEFYIG
jgi:hypothetical protein